MKKSLQRALSAGLASVLTLSLPLTAGATNSTTGSLQELPENYASFYQQHGYEKIADVFYNGEYISFVDAYPLVQDGTTFVPIGVLAKQIGATVEYIPETHSVGLVYKGDTIFFNIGETGFSVNGGEQEHLPYPTFIANDYTMVPVRFITAAFDLGLYWNGGHKQVIIADVDTLKEGLDTDYTIMNDFLAFANKTEVSNPLVTGNLAMVVENGDMTITTLTDMTVHTEDDFSALKYELDFAVDLGSYADELMAMIEEEQDSAEYAMVMTILERMGDFNFDVILDIQEMEYYFQCSLIPYVLPLATGMTSDVFNLTEETWYKISMKDLLTESERAEFMQQYEDFLSLNEYQSLESMVDYVLELSTTEDNHYFDCYGLIETILAEIHNDNFVKSGNNYVLQGNENIEGVQMNWNLTVKTSNNNVTGYEITLQAEDPYQSVELVLAQSSADTISIYFDMQLDQYSSVLLEGDFKVEYTSSPVQTKPDSNDIFDLSGMIG